jgi:hypothetical protein
MLWSQGLPSVAADMETTPETLDAIAEHITHFSLGGVQGFRKN